MEWERELLEHRNLEGFELKNKRDGISAFFRPVMGKGCP
jgi:hypothetical protein